MKIYFVLTETDEELFLVSDERIPKKNEKVSINNQTYIVLDVETKYDDNRLNGNYFVNSIIIYLQKYDSKQG